MNQLDSMLSSAFQENPISAALLGTLMDGGRVIVTGDLSESLLNMIPDILFFERREPTDLVFFSQLQARDIIFLEQQSVDDIWKINQHCGAQIALINDKPLDENLADYFTSESKLRSALLGLGMHWRKIQPLLTRGLSEGPLENKALFLDRDGVIIEDFAYNGEPSKVRLLPHAAEGLRKAREQGYFLIAITNQSGIGRGMLTWDQYEKVTHRMQEMLAEEKVFLDRILKAPFHEVSTLVSGLTKRSLRKPRPGMIHSVVQELRLDLGSSMLIGDSASDLIAGVLAGVGRIHLMSSPKVDSELQKWRNWPLISRTSVGIKPPVISRISECLDGVKS